MNYVLRENSEEIRNKILAADISVCLCASSKDSCWLNYNTNVGNGVHGKGCYGGDSGTSSQKEALLMFVGECKDIYYCKDVDEFINKINEFLNKSC